MVSRNTRPRRRPSGRSDSGASSGCSHRLKRRYELQSGGSFVESLARPPLVNERCRFLVSLRQMSSFGLAAEEVGGPIAGLQQVALQVKL